MRSDSVKNKTAILDVFSRAVQEDPSKLPSMSDLVAQTGLGRGTVYRHFSQPGDVLYAYFEDGFTRLYETYEPEWLKVDSQVLRLEFEAFLLRCYAFAQDHLSLLSTPEFHQSEGRTLAMAELRRKIFVTATMISERPLKPKDLSKWVDAIAYCVEVNHLSSSSPKELSPATSVRIAMTLLEEAIQPT